MWQQLLSFTFYCKKLETKWLTEKRPTRPGGLSSDYLVFDWQVIRGGGGREEESTVRLQETTSKTSSDCVRDQQLSRRKRERERERWLPWRHNSPTSVQSCLAFTGVHVHLLVTVAAVHGAAPVELALTLGGAADPRRVVAAAAAHYLTAVHAAGRPVTDTPPRPHRPWRKREKEMFKY